MTRDDTTLTALLWLMSAPPSNAAPTPAGSPPFAAPRSLPFNAAISNWISRPIACGAQHPSRLVLPVGWVDGGGEFFFGGGRESGLDGTISNSGVPQGEEGG